MSVLMGRKVAMPYIHPGTALSRIQKIVPNADWQMTRAIEGATGAGSKSILSAIFPNAKRGLCVWHLTATKMMDTRWSQARVTTT